MIIKSNSSSQNHQELVTISEEEQFYNICALIEYDVVQALKTANSTLKNKKYFQDLLEQGLATADASEIEVWLKYLVPRLGLRYIVQVLEKKLTLQPEQVQKASYWLSKFSATAREIELIQNLQGSILGEKYKSISPSGLKYKLILRIKSTNEYAIFGGTQLDSNGLEIVAEILDSHTFYPTGAVKLVSEMDLEILDPQPYND